MICSTLLTWIICHKYNIVYSSKTQCFMHHRFYLSKHFFRLNTDHTSFLTITGPSSPQLMSPKTSGSSIFLLHNLGEKSLNNPKHSCRVLISQDFFFYSSLIILSYFICLCWLDRSMQQQFEDFTLTLYSCWYFLSWYIYSLVSRVLFFL